MSSLSATATTLSPATPSPGSRPALTPLPALSYSSTSTSMTDTKRPPSPSSIPILATLIAAPRRFRTRTSIIALFALLALSFFCILHQHLNDAPISRPAPFHSSTGAAPHTHRPSKPLRPIQIKLSVQQELAALVAFIAALPSNALPETVVPSQPLDPDLVLGFDIRSSNAASELTTLVEDTWSRVPIVLLSKVVNYNTFPHPGLCNDFFFFLYGIRNTPLSAGRSNQS